MATPTLEQQKAEVTKQYRGDKWKDKVAAMNPNQIVALFKRFQAIGRIKV